MPRNGITIASCPKNTVIHGTLGTFSGLFISLRSKLTQNKWSVKSILFCNLAPVFT